jgi:hypothetical protein
MLGVSKYIPLMFIKYEINIINRTFVGGGRVMHPTTLHSVFVVTAVKTQK